MKKYLLALALVLALTVVPATAGAQTMADLQALIASLQAQIAVLTAQLNQTQTCRIIVSHDVAFGDEDNAADKNVTALQKYLERQGYLNMPAGAQYGFFGRITAAAATSWQRARGVSETDTSGFATISTRSRALINNCNTPIPTSAPRITSVTPYVDINGRTQFTVTGTGFLGSSPYVDGQGATYSASSLTDTSVLLLSVKQLSIVGTHNVYLKNSTTGQQSNTVTFQSGGTTQSSITLLSPKNGDTLIIGQPYTFRWQTTGISSDALLRTDGGAFRAENGQQWDGPFTNNMINDGSETVVIPMTSTPSSPDGHITFGICLDNSSLLPLCSNSVSIYLVRN
ncbi:MAG: peptidoglycan-binding domain-containing protein [bacterium]|nr:peptidoglycan-binding domain-containing protein [bacterium]